MNTSFCSERMKGRDRLAECV